MIGGSYLPVTSPKAPSTVRWFSFGDKKEIETEADDAATPPPNEEETAGEEEEEDELEFEEEIKPSKEEELEAQVKELKNQLLRSMAEQDNTRRIASRDIDQARQFAIKSFAKSLLDVSDNLERALDAVPQDALEKAKAEEKPDVLANLYEGIQLTEKGLRKAFESNGLVKFGEAGEVFDPNKHEALFEYPDAAREAGTVGEVMKPGFMLNSRVLRPAEVGVIKKA